MWYICVVFLKCCLSWSSGSSKIARTRAACTLLPSICCPSPTWKKSIMSNLQNSIRIKKGSPSSPWLFKSCANESWHSQAHPWNENWCLGGLSTPRICQFPLTGSQHMRIFVCRCICRNHVRTITFTSFYAPVGSLHLPTWRFLTKRMACRLYIQCTV